MRRFADWVSGAVGLVLLAGFFWLGLASQCSEVPVLTDAERSAVNVLCLTAKARAGVEVRREMLRTAEWRLWVQRWREAEAAEARDFDAVLKRGGDLEFAEFTEPVVDAFMERLRALGQVP